MAYKPGDVFDGIPDFDEILSPTPTPPGSPEPINNPAEAPAADSTAQDLFVDPSLSQPDINTMISDLDLIPVPNAVGSYFHANGQIYCTMDEDLESLFGSEASQDGVALDEGVFDQGKNEKKRKAFEMEDEDDELLQALERSKMDTGGVKKFKKRCMFVSRGESSDPEINRKRQEMEAEKYEQLARAYAEAMNSDADDELDVGNNEDSHELDSDELDPDESDWEWQEVYPGGNVGGEPKGKGKRVRKQ